MAILFLFFIFLSHIISIKSKDIFFFSKILEESFHNNNLNRIEKDYDVNIQIIENKTITNDFLIKTSYISRDFSFDFFYKGLFFYLNNTNLDLLSNSHMAQNNWILLIDSYPTFNDYVKNNKNLIKYLTRVIIIPKNSFPTINIISRYCLYDLSIYLIEIEQDIFNQIKSYSNNIQINNYYYAKIVSKKCEFFPYKEIIEINSIFLFVLSIISLFFRFILKLYRNSYYEKQINLLEKIIDNIYSKIFILLLLFFDLNSFYNYEGFIVGSSSFIKFISILLMLINKASLSLFILNYYYELGIFLHQEGLLFLIKYLIICLIMIFDILFQVFKSPFKTPYMFYYSNIFIIISIFLFISFFSMKNTIFLFKVIFKIRKCKKFKNKYRGGIILKIFIIFIQYIIFLIYSFIFLGINKYFLIKKGFYFILEKHFIFQWLDSFLIICLGIISIPVKCPEGFELDIVIMKDIFKNTLKINGENNYISNIPKDILKDENDIKKFEKNNKEKYYTIINPKLFLHKENDIKNINLLEQNIKIGKLIIA